MIEIEDPEVYQLERQKKPKIVYKVFCSNRYATFTSPGEAQIDSGHGTGAELSTTNPMNTLQLLKERVERAQRQQAARKRIAPVCRPLSYYTSAHQSPARLNQQHQAAKTLAYRGIPYEAIRSNWL